MTLRQGLRLVAKSLTGRLLLTIALVFLLAFVILYAAIAPMIAGTFLARHDTSAQAVASLIDRMLQSLRSDMDNNLDLILGDRGFDEAARQAGRSGDAAPLKAYLNLAVRKSRINILEVTRGDWKTLASTNEALSGVKGIDELRVINKAFLGQRLPARFILRGDRVFLFSAQPVFLTDKIVARSAPYAILGAWVSLDDVWAWEMFSFFEMHVMLLVHGRPISSSLRAAIGRQLMGTGPEQQPAAPLSFELDSNSYRMAVVPVGNGDEPSFCSLAVGTDTAEVDAYIRKSRLGLAGGMFLLSGLLMLFIFWATLSTTRSLKQLVSATGLIASSGPEQFPGVDISPAEPEEIEVLATGLNRMNSALKARLANLRRTNEELRAAQERLVKSEKLAAIGQLASSVGHELRNPLAALRNAVYYIRDALKDSALVRQDPQVREFLDVSDQAISDSSRIINDLLTFSKVVRLSLEPTDLNALLAEVRKGLEVPSNVRVVELFAAGMPPVPMDPQKMRQVFINLANNAVQAMPDGGELRLATRLDDLAGGGARSIRVDFQDNGVGISAADRRKLFEPMFTTKSKGTGLGLAISLGIVAAHGGRIDVSSEAGAGALFSVVLPLQGPPGPA